MMEIAGQETKVSLGKRTTIPKLEFPPGSTLRLAAILLTLGFLLLWGAQRILQAGLQVH